MNGMNIDTNSENSVLKKNTILRYNDNGTSKFAYYLKRVSKIANTYIYTF